MKKDLSKILREHNQAKKTLQTPVPEGMVRYGNPEEYLIGSPLKLGQDNGTFKKNQLSIKLQSLKSRNKLYAGLTTEEIYEKLQNRILYTFNGRN